MRPGPRLRLTAVMTLLVFGAACVSTKLPPISSSGADSQPLKDERKLWQLSRDDARLNMERGRLALATTQLDRVRDLMPEDPEIHLLIGELELKKIDGEKDETLRREMTSRAPSRVGTAGISRRGVRDRVRPVPAVRGAGSQGRRCIAHPRLPAGAGTGRRLSLSYERVTSQQERFRLLPARS